MFWRNKLKNREEKNLAVVKRAVMEGHLLCSASEIGKCIVNRCLNLGYDVNTNKLQKLLVLAYGEYLCKTGKQLFREQIEICEHGVRIREVEHDFLRYVIKFDTLFYEWYVLLESQDKVLNDVVRNYGNMAAFEINNSIKLKGLREYKNRDGFINDKNIKKVFEEWSWC